MFSALSLIRFRTRSVRPRMWRCSMSRLAMYAAALLTAALAATPSLDAQPAGGPPALVLIVRHAEKADNSNDPVLSAAGSARALALAEALGDATVDHVIVTHRQRTLLTAAPLVAQRNLTPQTIPFTADMEAHIAEIAAAVRARSGEVVLVVGHSNTVPAIVHALGGPRMPDLCDARYAALFAVVPGLPGAPARVVVSRFGADDPPGADSCAGMIAR